MLDCVRTKSTHQDDSTRRIAGFAYLQVPGRCNNLNFKVMNPILVPNLDGKAVNILGTAMLIRVHGRDTGGGLSVVETHDEPGGGPPLHIHHREDETFQILEGEYEFTIGEQTILTKPGTTLFAPRGIAHTYRYIGKAPGRLMCIITPSGFEGFFEEIGAMSSQQQQDIPRVMEIAKKFELEILAQ